MMVEHFLFFCPINDSLSNDVVGSGLFYTVVPSSVFK